MRRRHWTSICKTLKIYDGLFIMECRSPHIKLRARKATTRKSRKIINKMDLSQREIAAKLCDFLSCFWWFSLLLSLCVFPIGINDRIPSVASHFISIFYATEIYFWMSIVRADGLPLCICWRYNFLRKKNWQEFFVRVFNQCNLDRVLFNCKLL